MDCYFGYHYQRHENAIVAVIPNLPFPETTGNNHPREAEQQESPTRHSWSTHRSVAVESCHFRVGRQWLLLLMLSPLLSFQVF